MKIQIYSSDIELSQSLRNYISTQIEKRAAKHRDRIDSVTVRLKDLNGPKGGTDKQCTVEIAQPQTPTVVVSKRSGTLGKCINAALKRAMRTSLRQTRKQNLYQAVRLRKNRFQSLIARSRSRSEDQVDDFDGTMA